MPERYMMKQGMPKTEMVKCVIARAVTGRASILQRYLQPSQIRWLRGNHNLETEHIFIGGPN
jgi:hypothetical protein